MLKQPGHPHLQIISGSHDSTWRFLFDELDIAPSTRRAYNSGWCHFAAWCQRQGHEPLPASAGTVCAYLRAYEGSGTGHLQVATLQKHIVAITQAHIARNEQPPTRLEAVRREMKRIRRRYKVAPVKKKALTVEDMRQIVRVLPRTQTGIRDRALLLIGLAAALRRSELAALQRSDIEMEDAHGLRVTIRTSKTDQLGRGRVVGVPFGERRETCPVLAYLSWIEASGIRSGPVWRSIDRHGNLGSTAISDRSIALVVKRAIRLIELDDTRYGGHSLRSGLATEAARNGVHERDIANQTGHKSVAVLRGYIQDEQIWQNNAAASIGL